jgi:magnesium transporter
MEHQVSRKSGMPPGSVVYVGRKREFVPTVRRICFDSQKTTDEVVGIESLDSLNNQCPMAWINVAGVHDESLVASVGNLFQVHPLFIEDIVNTSQRPKGDNLEGALMVILKLFWLEGDAKKLSSDQITVILKGDRVISFEERPGEALEPLRKRLVANAGQVVNRGCDYLFFTVIDACVDSYYGVIEELAEMIENFEPAMSRDYERIHYLHRIQRLNRNLLILRKSLYPLREAVGRLARGDYEQISAGNLRYFTDINDHLLQMLDNIDFYIQMTNNLRELHMANISYRMNKVMQALTAISAVFIPLTFLVGVYGMNFDVMPELTWKYGYFVLWGVMIAIVVVLYTHFKRRGWF